MTSWAIAPLLLILAVAWVLERIERRTPTDNTAPPSTLDRLDGVR